MLSNKFLTKGIDCSVLWLADLHAGLQELYLLVCRFVFNHFSSNRATAEAVAAPKTKRDRVTELHYITRGARDVTGISKCHR